MQNPAPQPKDHTLTPQGIPYHSLIAWDTYSRKWIDPCNNYFCHSLHSDQPDGAWMCAARYGWPDGEREPKIFADQISATMWFVNFLHSRHVQLQLDYARRTAGTPQKDTAQ